MGAVPAPAGQTCVFHAERTEQINEMGACIRMVESRLGDMAARMAVGNEVMTTIQRDLDGAHRSIREHRAQVSNQFKEVTERLERIAEVGAVTKRNAERLDQVERTLDKMDNRLKDIEEIAARREGIEEKVESLERLAVDLTSSLRTIRYMFAIIMAIVPTFGSVIAWIIRHQ